jgi:hypothetical protein
VMPIFSTSGLADVRSATSGVVQALRSRYCSGGSSCSIIDQQLSHLAFKEQVLWTSSIQDQPDQSADRHVELAAKFEMGTLTIWYGLQSGTVLRIDSLTRMIHQSPADVVLA